MLLMCRAISGEDIKDVTWSKDEYHLSVTNCPPVTTSHCTIKGGKLLLKNANSTDSARYRCHTKKSSGPLSVEVNGQNFLLDVTTFIETVIISISEL